MADKYDQAIEYLTLCPDKIDEAWWEPNDYDDSEVAQAHCLFQYTGERRQDGQYCGCLTQIRLSPSVYPAPTDELTNAIASDDRIPKCPTDITVADLPVFAEWQRRLDAMGVRNG